MLRAGAAWGVECGRPNMESGLISGYLPPATGPQLPLTDLAKPYAGWLPLRNSEMPP